MSKSRCIEELVGFDSFSEAEKLTGRDYKTDKFTKALGMGLFFENNQKKKDALIAAKDTHFSMPLEEYFKIVINYGFEEVLRLPFKNEDGCNDCFYVFWHPLGILLKFDTYWSGKSLNGGNFYYNIKPYNQENISIGGVTSSGGFKETDDGWIWSDDHDCREATILHIEKLKEWGEFQADWVDSPFLWLLHYQDTKTDGYDYKAINLERIAMLPHHVQKAISVLE